MESTKREQERQQKALEAEIKAKDDAAAKHKREMAELQVKFEALNLPIPPPPRPPPPEKKYAMATYDFDSDVSGDLSFKKGERIRVLKHSASVNEWWEGQRGDAKGVFPGNYVKLDSEPKAKAVSPKTAFANKFRSRSTPSINTLLLWSASITLWADTYFLVGYISDMSGNIPADLDAQRLAANNGNRYAVFGENGSYYVHYHDALMQCWTLRSENFPTQYPEAEKYLTTYEQYGCPICVSLGKDSMYFLRTSWGASYSIPKDAELYLGDMS